MAAPRLPEHSGGPILDTVVPMSGPHRIVDVDGLADRWAALMREPAEPCPGLHARLVALLQRIAARCRDEPFWPSRGRGLGAEMFRSGICGTSSDPLHPAEDVLAPSLELLRVEAPGVLGLQGPARRRLAAVLDELAAGFAAALRDRVHDEHENLLRSRLADVAARDALTELPNRAVTEQRVHRAFAAASLEWLGCVGLCALDLDGFAGVNDRFGRAVGDELLVAVAARLRQAVAPHLLTRTGGDEFAVLVEEAPDPAAVHALGCRIRDALGPAFRIGGRTMTLSAAVGVAVATPATGSPTELMRAADVALSWAKTRGRGRVVLFDPDHDAEESARAGLLAQLGDGVARGEFCLHYQPLVGLTDGRVRGVEALVRWQHPELGMLAPSRFVGAAESSGTIRQLDHWVLEKACAQAAAWWHEWGTAAPCVSVNVSPVELVEPGWAADVARVIELTGVPPSQLQLEITEQAVLGDETVSLTALGTLRDLGVRLALDDFGSGYSGLTRLRQLPVDAIKIDGAFVDGLRHVEPDPLDY